MKKLIPTIIAVVFVFSLILGLKGVLSQVLVSPDEKYEITKEVIDTEKLYEVNTVITDNKSASVSGGIFLGIGGISGEYNESKDAYYVYAQETDRGIKVFSYKVTDPNCPGYELIPNNEQPYISTIKETKTPIKNPLGLYNTITETYQILYVPESSVDYSFDMNLIKGDK